MNLNRRKLIATLSAAAIAGVNRDAFASPPNHPTPPLYRVDDPKTVLAGARPVFTKDLIGTLITLDADCRPRARSILVSPPDDNMHFWMATRPGSRKLTQLAANPTATIHFADDEHGAYVSIVGQAHASTDPALIQARNPYNAERLAHYFPHFPNDFVLLQFKPQWLEVATEELASDPKTWQPQGIEL